MSRRSASSSIVAQRIGLGLAAACAVAALAASLPAAAQFGGPQVSYKVVTVVDGFQNPWSIAWLPSGEMLVTERPGRLRIVRNGELLPDPVPGVPEVRATGQGGLMEVAVHPDFESNRLVYLSFSKPNAEGLATTAVIRGRFENDRLNDVEEVFEAKAWSDAVGHYGGKIVFDGNGYMFITVGERMAPTSGDLETHPAQDPSNHQGTVVRLHDDGRVPDDNPFVGDDDVLPEIWSYGHRNPQGLAMNPETGDLWATEHGPQGGDELNLILPGRNYGWPVIGYGANYGSGTPIHGSRERDGMEQPAAFWVPSIAASGLMFYTGDAFPAWQGSLFAGGLSASYSKIERVSLDGTTVSGRQPLLSGEYRIRDVRQGPDGFIYIAVDSRAGPAMTPIIRLEPDA